MKPHKALIGVFVLLTLTISFSLPAKAQNTISTVDLLQKQIQELLKQIQSLQSQITQLKSELGAPSEAPVSTSTPVVIQEEQDSGNSVFLEFTRTLVIGGSGDDVRRLQEFLSKDKTTYPEGLITGYFGPATERAVKRWQTRQGIESVGRVGPKTILKLNELIQFEAGQSGNVPSGLLIAPGILKKLATSTTVIATSTINIPPSVATSTIFQTIATSTIIATSSATIPNQSSISTISALTSSSTAISSATATYNSSLNLTGVSNLFSKIWGPGSNGITLGGGLNFSTKVGVGWSQQYGGLYVTSYSIQGSGTSPYVPQYYLTQSGSINVSVTGPTGSIIEVWDLESMTVVVKNITPGSPAIFTAQPNRRYGGFAWYSDNSQKDIAIFATQTTLASTVASTTTATSTSTTNTPIFTITSPNGGETLSAGNSYAITWASAGASVSSAKISLYKGGILKEILISETSNNGNWNWAIPPSMTPGIDYQIRIFNSAYPNNWDDSNGVFNITMPPTSPATSPIGFWKFDGGGNNEITSAPNAVSVGSAAFKTSGGKFNGYLYLPGSSDYGKIPYNSMFDLPNSFTVEFWFRQRSNQSFNQSLVYKGTPTNNYNFNIIRYLWNEYNHGAVIAGSTVAGTGYWHQASNNNEPPHNAWHHVVYTKTPTSIAYYIDGALINSDSFTVSSEYGGPVKTPAVDIIIGNPAPDTDIDNLRIYNYALNSGEVQYNYAENISPSASSASNSSASTATTTPTTSTVTLVAPTYIRADWSYGWWDIVGNTMGQRIIFQYPTDTGKKTTKFRLYSKAPGASSFSLAAEFFGIDSTSCSKNDKSIVGQWILDNNGSCSYWGIAYVSPGTTSAYSGGTSFPISSFPVGEHSFYVTAVDSVGNEGSPSPTAKLTYLNPLTITSPTMNQTLASLTPTFQWSSDSSLPAALPHFAVVFDKQNSTNPIWSSYFSGGTSKAYDGSSLDPTKKYLVSVFGIDVNTAQTNATLVMPSSVIEFSVSTPSSAPNSTSTPTSTSSVAPSTNFALILEALASSLKNLQQLLR